MGEAGDVDIVWGGVADILGMFVVGLGVVQEGETVLTGGRPGGFLL